MSSYPYWAENFASAKAQRIEREETEHIRKVLKNIRKYPGEEGVLRLLQGHNWERSINEMKPEICCDTCEHRISVGDGDSICTEGVEPRIVIETYEPTEDHCWCGGRFWEEQE